MKTLHEARKYREYLEKKLAKKIPGIDCSGATVLELEEAVAKRYPLLSVKSKIIEMVGKIQPKYRKYRFTPRFAIDNPWIRSLLP